MYSPGVSVPGDEAKHRADFYCRLSLRESSALSRLRIRVVLDITRSVVAPYELLNPKI